MKHLLKLSFLICIALAFAACEKTDIANEGEPEQPTPSGKSYKVNISTRSTGSDITYPVTVYAYDENNAIAAQQTISSPDDKLSLQLASGSYTITAVSGPADFSAGYNTVPLLMGHSDVTIAESAATVNILMSYSVASLSVKMSAIPADVTAVSLSLSDQYSSIDGKGTYSGSTKCTIPCSKQSDGSWSTGKVYVLPGCGTNTVMSLSLTSPSGTETFGLTYPEPLKAAVPYSFTGVYSGAVAGIKVSGTITCGEWGNEVNSSFTFGPSGPNTFGDVTTAESFTVSELPAQGSVWNGHVVAYIDGNDALLISLQEWNSLTSALYESDPDVAANIALAYTEGNIASWSIPTNDQARLLRSVWKNSTISSLNDALTSAGGTGVSLTDKDGKNVRYLCEAATYTFSFADSGSVGAAGKTVKTYRLRLIKPVHFTVE